MKLAAYYLGKTLELLGLLCMPTALYYGFVLEGAEGMVQELKWMGIGGGIFLMGRALETSAGEAP